MAAERDSYQQMAADLGERGRANNLDLLAFATWLHDQPGLEEAGHVGGGNSYRTRSTNLWWYQPEGPAAQALLAAARAEAARRHLGFDVTAVPWTQAQIRAATDVVFGPHGRTILSFTPTGGEGPQPPDGVLLLFGDLPGASDGELATLARRAQAALRLPIPVVVRHRKPSKGPWG